MKKIVILSSIVVLSNGLFAQQQIGNGDMESWDNVGSSTEEPTNWNSFKTASGGMASLFGSTTIARSTAIRAGATGQYCARIWSKSVLGVVANGNMTLGRINMGSSTATDPSNYNYSVTADVNFSEALTDAPDSLVFWVKYTAAAGQEARVSAVLHDTYDYRDGFTADANSEPHKVAEISYNYGPTGGQWVRKSVAWNYAGPASTHTYVLITFATNKTPGGGAANDEVLIDDVQLIYNPDEPINLPIAVMDDNVTTDFETPIIIDVISNDVDPENDIDNSSLTITVNPIGGNAVINTTDFTITYTPNTGFWGDDQFTYSVCDNGVPSPVTCDDAIVYITVNEGLGLDENELNSIMYSVQGRVLKFLTPLVEGTRVEVVNAEGKVVKTATNAQELELDLVNGIYYARVTVNGHSRTIKFLLN